MAQWNKNTVPKCEDKTCSDEVLVTVEKYARGTYRRVLKAVYIPYNGLVKFDFPEASKEESSIKCPNCGKPLMKDNFYFNCGCGFKISHNICSKNISDSDMKDLINNKKTGLIKGFKSKAGKSFNAKLILEDNRIKFVFD